MPLPDTRRNLLEQLAPEPRATTPAVQALIREFFRDGDVEGAEHLLKQGFADLGADDPKSTAEEFTRLARSVQRVYMENAPPAPLAHLTARQKQALKDFLSRV
jgi:hypothetical protein